MFLGGKRPPTVIRRVSVPVKQTDRKPGAPRPAGTRPSSNLSSNGALRKQTDPAKASRVHKSTAANRPRSKLSPAQQRPRVVKRKAPSPGVQLFSSGSDDDGNDEEIDLTTTKKPRINGHDSLKPDPKRRIFQVTSWTPEDNEKWPMRSGADITTGQYAKEYRAVFENADSGAFVELQYPSNCPTERYVDRQSRCGSLLTIGAMAVSSL
jgi:hypothetical protein